MECFRSPDISRIDVFPCLSDYAGTDSAVLLAMQVRCTYHVRVLIRDVALRIVI